MGEEIGEMELMGHRSRLWYGMEQIERPKRLAEGGGKYMLGEIAERVLGISGGEMELLCNHIYQDENPIHIHGEHRYLPREMGIEVASEVLSTASKISKGLLITQEKDVRIVAKRLMKNLKEHKVNMGLFSL